MRAWTPIVVAAASAMTLAVTGCGSDDDTATSTTATSAASAAPIKLERKTIGVVNLVRQSPAEDKIDQLYEKAGKAMGWDIKIVDGGGDPQKIANAAQSFVNQKVDALITTSIDAPALRGALVAAKGKKIPTIATNGGTADSDLFTAKYEEDETKMGQILGDYIKQKQPDAKIGNLKTNLAASGVQRDVALHKVFDKSAFVAEQNVDLSNPVVNTEKALTDMLTAHPDINAVHAVYDNMAQAAISTIRAKNSDAKLYTTFTTANNVKNLRNKTALEAVSDNDLPKTGAVALDQLVQYFEKQTPIDPDALKKNDLTYDVVSRDDIDQKIPNGGDDRYPVDQVLKPFLEKWAKEYPGS